MWAGTSAVRKSEACNLSGLFILVIESSKALLHWLKFNFLHTSMIRSVYLIVCFVIGSSRAKN